MTHCERTKELVDSCAAINIDNGGWVTEYSVLFSCVVGRAAKNFFPADLIEWRARCSVNDNVCIVYA